ncbi:hypothetical protein GCM10023212_21190 [Luteolibacter yonseiensis]|nr:hypothetical protein [Luteolibacter yonseiensis]
MPKSRYLKGFGIVVFLIGIGFIIWSDGEAVGGKSAVARNGTMPRSQHDSPRQKEDVDFTPRATRDVNAESRVRSLLQIAPGEVGNIRIPSSGIGLLLSEEGEKKWETSPLIPLSREQAIHGLEEILRKGNSLGSRVDTADGKIIWNADGIVVNGEVTEEGDASRTLEVAIDGPATKGLFHEGVIKVQGYSFFLVRAPGADAGGVLLVFGEEAKRGNQ